MEASDQTPIFVLKCVMQVLVAGSCTKVSRDELTAAAKFYGKELLPEDTYWRTRIYVDLFPRSLNKDYLGGITLPREGVQPELFHIKIKSSQSSKGQLTALAHEMVHVQQIASGRFGAVYRGHRAVGMKWCKIRVSKEALRDGYAPWEIEAYDREGPLYRDFLKSIR